MPMCVCRLVHNRWMLGRDEGATHDARMQTQLMLQQHCLHHQSSSAHPHSLPSPLALLVVPSSHSELLHPTPIRHPQAHSPPTLHLRSPRQSLHRRVELPPAQQWLCFHPCSPRRRRQLRLRREPRQRRVKQRRPLWRPKVGAGRWRRGEEGAGLKRPETDAGSQEQRG